MTFTELAKQRYSCRHYTDQPVEEEKLMKVLEAARIAPSACNLKPIIIYVIRDEENRKAISSAYHREWLLKAPVILVVCTNHGEGWVRQSDEKDHCDIDAAIATDHMTLQATELGLGTCWICNFDPFLCKEILDLPENIEPVVILPLAYPADKPDVNRHESQRKPLDKIVRYEF